MSELTPPAPREDQPFLLAILALQMELVTQSQFVEACSLWAAHKQSSVVEILTQRGWLTAQDAADLERLLQRRLQKSPGSAAAMLAQPQVVQTLQQLPPPVREQIDGTVSRAPAGDGERIELATALHTPQAQERYTITRLHASGGIGQVWLARDRSLDRDVALKEIRPDRADSATVWARFVREARITGQLEHPGIIPIYELGQMPGGERPFYTMRFIRGSTLREAIQAYHQKRAGGETQPVEFQTLLRALAGVCNAVAYAHSRGVLHRDLKPANIVLGDFGEVMVLDWGLARQLGQRDPEAEAAAAEVAAGDDACSRTMQGQVLGTPAYMAPEQAEGNLEAIGVGTDVYGLGAILYELLTNRPPFTGPSVSEVLGRVRTQPPESPRSLVRDAPRPLEAVCLKCLAKAPGDRYASARDIADEINHFLADEPVRAYREPWALRARRWARAHRTLVTSLFAAMVAAVPILLVGLVTLDRSERAERRAREQSEANYARALVAANAMTEELARGIRPLLGTQRGTVLAILDRTREIFAELMNDPRPATAAAQGRMFTLLAELYREAGSVTQGAGAGQQAVDCFEQLLSRAPDSGEWRVALARARHRLAWNLFDQGHDDAAMELFATVIRELEALEQSLDPTTRGEILGSAYTMLGNAERSMGRLRQAEEAYRKGYEHRRRAAEALPGEPAILTGLALSLEKWGGFEVAFRDREAGVAHLRQAVETHERLRQRDPDQGDWSLHVVRSTLSLVQALNLRHERTELLDRIAPIVARFAPRDPEHQPWQREGLRYQFERQRLQPRQISGTPQERAEPIRHEIDQCRAMLRTLQSHLRRDPENFLALGDIGNIHGRIARGLLDLSRVDADADAAALRAEIREQIDASVGAYQRCLERSPRNYDLRVGLQYARWVETQLLQQGPLDVAGARAVLAHHRDSLQLDLQQANRHPDEPSWKRDLERSIRRAVVLLQRDDNPPPWEQLYPDAQCRELLLGIARDLDPLFASNPGDELRALRRHLRPHLERLARLAPLADADREWWDRWRAARD